MKRGDALGCARLMVASAFSVLAATISTSAHAQSTSARVLEGGPEGVTPPVPIAPLVVADTDFPLAVLTEAQEGTVVLNLLVDVEGRVTFAQRLTSSGSDALDQAAQQIARTRWTFQPARKDGEVAIGSVKVEVNWRLPLRPADELTVEMVGFSVPGKIVVPPKPAPTNRIISSDLSYASVRQQEQGEVALRVEVLENGTAGEIQLIDTSGFPRLDESAIRATKRFTFEPGTVDGQPTRMWTHAMLQFTVAPDRETARQPIRRNFCHTRPILSAPVLVNSNATADEVGLRQWAHAKADGTIDDAVILTKKGWMHFNPALVENLSKAAALPPAAAANRAEACWFNASLSVRPMVENSAQALLQRGVVNRRLDEFDRAIADYTKAIAINPNLATAYNSRGNAYAAKADYESALKDYNQAIELGPAIPAHWGNRGNLHMRLGQYEEAASDYAQAIKLNPRIPAGYNSRCYALAAAGKAREALNDCDRALRLSPGNATFLDSRGFAYFRSGDYRAAITDYDAAIKANPKFADALYGRGVAKIRSGNTGEGNADIEAAVKLNPDIAARMAKFGVAP